MNSQTEIPNILSIKNKQFLVTGGAGFIGSHIVSYLLNNGAKQVRVLDNLSTGFMSNLEEHKTNPAFTFIEGDITDYQTCFDACKNIDGVFHNAALGSVSRSMQDPMATNKANVSGFINVLFAAKNQHVKRVVYASSSSVYGDDKSSEKQEHITGNLLSPYAVSKKTDELYADVFAKSYDMEIIGLRYFNVYGPKQNPHGAYAAVIPIFISNLLKGETPSIFGDGTTSRDFTFINEESPEYKAERKGDIKNSLANISKSKNLLGYEPLVDLNNGMKLTIDWYKNNLV